MGLRDLPEDWACESDPGCAWDCTSEASSTGVRLKAPEAAEQPPIQVQCFWDSLSSFLSPMISVWSGLGLGMKSEGK
jgi:hypothetical protein